MTRAQKKRKRAPARSAQVSPELPVAAPARLETIPTPAPGVIFRRLIIAALGVLGVVMVLKGIKTRLNGGKRAAPAVSAPAVPATRGEMAKPVTERRMTEVFTFDGVPTKWGYSGWAKDGTANPRLDHGIYTGGPLAIKGVVFKSGIGTHAPSEIVFDLKGQVKKFHCKVGIDNSGNVQSMAVFSIHGDKKKLFKSPVMRVDTPALPVDLDVSGVQELNLKVDPHDPKVGWTHSDWVDIHFEK